MKRKPHVANALRVEEEEEAHSKVAREIISKAKEEEEVFWEAFWEI